MTPISLLESAVISPYDELVAYECMYSEDDATLKKMTDATVRAGLLPSEAAQDRYGLVVPASRHAVEECLSAKLGRFSVSVNGTPEWPAKLADSERPTPLIYYRGDIGLLNSKSVSVVGARKASQDGLKRARRVARELVGADIAVVTGLAAGIDTAAAISALDEKGRVIGVIGTPIDTCYPKENQKLQEAIATDHLLISQVPFYKYSLQPFKTKRYYFPERNELMAAVSDATVIVEASDTSGTRTQARACVHQGRPLFFMRSLVDDPSVTWVRKFIENGAQVLDDVAQVIDAISG